ncbi:MAG: hypothetical protein NT007_13255, partial [Candidatus Kapabacteria bacterium]|nr:hypothetical protein [Candidatus Kapabacteria bacterium]
RYFLGDSCIRRNDSATFWGIPAFAGMTALLFGGFLIRRNDSFILRVIPAHAGIPFEYNVKLLNTDYL